MKNVLWISDLSGSMNQATAPHLLADNQFKLLVNVDQSEVGAISHRLGTEVFLNSIDAINPVVGLGMYVKQNGSKYLHMASGGKLYVSNESGGTWTEQDSTFFNGTPTARISMANHIGNHYFAAYDAGSQLSVYYGTETGSTSLVTPFVNGAFLAGNGPYLMIVSPETGKALWSDVGTHTFDTGVNFIYLNGLGTGIATFGNGRPFVIFTEDNYTIFDPAAVSAVEVQGFGCASHASIQVVKGYIIYLSREGFYMMGMNDAFPVDISRVLKNEKTKNAVLSQITGTNYQATASGVVGDKYYCALRNLATTVSGYQLDDCIVEIDIAQQTSKVHTFTQGGLASVLSKFVNGDKEIGLYAGSLDNATVYRLNVEDVVVDENRSGTTASVTSRIVTKDYAFYNSNKGVVEKKNVIGLHFKYRSDGPITIKYSLDGNETYATFARTLPASTAGYSWVTKELPFGKECKTISLDLSATDDFTLYGFGFEIEGKDNTGIALR